MSVKSWKAPVGLFSSARNWSPSEAPVAGDKLYIQSGTAVLFNTTFGSDDAETSIGLIGPTTENSPQVIAYNVTFKNVDINNISPPYTDQAPADYYSLKHGRLFVGGTVTNDGGSISTVSNQGSGGRNSIDITVGPGSTLINKGTISVNVGSTMTITGYGGSTVENNQLIRCASGDMTISTHLTGTGVIGVSGGALGGAYGGSLEIDAAVDAGQTVSLGRAVLQLDQPLSFMGQVSADPSFGGGRVDLEGLSAASWGVNGSSVEFFDAAGSLVNTLRFTTPQDAGALAVYATTDPAYGSVVSIGSGGGFGAPTPDALLPYHTDTALAA